MDFEIKKATIENLKDIQRLNLRLFKKEYDEYDKTLDCRWTFGEHGESYYRKRITEDDGFAYVAMVDDHVVGYLVGGLKTNKCRLLDNIAVLENMFIEEDYRSNGIGTALVDEYYVWCREKKIKRVSTDVFSINEAAVRFYKKNGFEGYELIMERNL